jgi:cytochrome c5
VAIAFLCAWALPAYAEVIELKDGSKIEGKITAKTGTEVMVNTEGIEVRVNGEEIKAIDGMPFTCDYKAIYEKKCAEVGPTDVEGRFKLALWCEEHKLKDEMNAELERVLSLDANHEGANRKMGRINYQGQWRTPEELKKLGFVKKDGQWMTPDEASQADGKVQYRGSWVRPEEAKRLEARQFSRYVPPCKVGLFDQTTMLPVTHTIFDLNAQIMRLELLNMWKPTPDQLKRMWPVLNEAEADRQMLLAKLIKAWPEIEASFIALRNEALKGVVDSFDQNAEVERRAGSNEGIIVGLKKGASMRLYTHADKFMAILSPSQKDMLYSKYCAMCHSTSFMKGGFGKELRGTQAGVDFLEKIRKLSEDEFSTKKCEFAEEALKKFGRGPQTLLGKKAQKVGKRSAQDMDGEEMTAADIMRRARLAGESEWARTKFNFAAELEAPNQEERLVAIRTNAAKEKGSFLTDTKTQGMVSEALFDGNLREVVAMKLGIPKEQMLVKASREASLIPEFKDGASAFQFMCTMCHTMDRINKATKSPDGWRATVQKRLHQGNSDDPKVVDMISEYLINRKAGEQAEAK